MYNYYTTCQARTYSLLDSFSFFFAFPYIARFSTFFTPMAQIHQGNRPLICWWFLPPGIQIRRNSPYYILVLWDHLSALGGTRKHREKDSIFADFHSGVEEWDCRSRVCRDYADSAPDSGVGMTSSEVHGNTHTVNHVHSWRAHCRLSPRGSILPASCDSWNGVARDLITYKIGK